MDSRQLKWTKNVDIHIFTSLTACVFKLKNSAPFLKFTLFELIIIYPGSRRSSSRIPPSKSNASHETSRSVDPDATFKLVNNVAVCRGFSSNAQNSNQQDRNWLNNETILYVNYLE